MMAKMEVAMRVAVKKEVRKEALKQDEMEVEIVSTKLVMMVVVSEVERAEIHFPQLFLEILES